MCSVIAYLTILGTAVGGLFGAPWFALIVGAVALFIVTLVEHHHFRVRFSAVGMSDVYQSFALSNVGTSLIAATAAYLLGSVVRLVAA